MPLKYSKESPQLVNVCGVMHGRQDTLTLHLFSLYLHSTNVNSRRTDVVTTRHDQIILRKDGKLMVSRRTIDREDSLAGD